MKANPDQHLFERPRRTRPPVVEALLILGVIGALTYWYLSENTQEPDVVIEAPAPTRQAFRETLSDAPDIPRREDKAASGSPTTPQHQAAAGNANDQPSVQPGPQVATVSLEEGDARVRDFVNGPGSTLGLGKLASSPHPIATTAALIDGASRGLLLRKILPLSPPSTTFSVTGEGGLLHMAPDSYERYNSFAETVASLDINDIANGFHQLRQLYEAAYDELGLDTAEFDNAVIRTLDTVLATPEIKEPIAVKRKSVIYVYVDPALESLPPLQKQLLRMGPENILLIKQFARAMRNRLLEPGGY